MGEIFSDMTQGLIRLCDEMIWDSQSHPPSTEERRGALALARLMLEYALRCPEDTNIILGQLIQDGLPKIDPEFARQMESTPLSRELEAIALRCNTGIWQQ